ncbi:MAG: hypothetical protein UX87_C0007G0003 [Candidatus Amesbacteria bacterium GW2011_GWA1_47_16]|uniref:Uncharacterized protein n=2 Tax=Candidatus Amesiibacteriota TaxID=1752730 RepID=A0A1F4Z2Y8_9BACT|nr:MAG: hypothetical protein UX87_C0007G0003 [Candidatus Amesbacteria bacterium GW2011_GWA1_47_16]OGD00397.1 MAG: hypothetical protein A2972_03975 [Candidatus Amesbacteria bacterium RIFCSPLOWO2_01_FULL_47_33]
MSHINEIYLKVKNRVRIPIYKHRIEKLTNESIASGRTTYRQFHYLDETNMDKFVRLAGKMITGDKSCRADFQGLSEAEKILILNYMIEYTTDLVKNGYD